MRSRGNLAVWTRRFVTRVLFQGSRARGEASWSRRTRRHRAIDGRRDHPRRWRDQQPAVAAPLGDRRGGRPRRARDPGGRRPAGVGRNLQDHLEVYVQHQSLKPVSMQPSATQLWRRPFIGAQWLFLRIGTGSHQPFRRRRVRPLERRRHLPEPDVPFPAARDPLRRLGGRDGPRLPGPRRADVLGRARDR